MRRSSTLYTVLACDFSYALDPKPFKSCAVATPPKPACKPPKFVSGHIPSEPKLFRYYKEFLWDGQCCCVMTHIFVDTLSSLVINFR